MTSLLSQTCSEYEMILVDDGSTDQSAFICDRYAEKYPERVRTVHKKNGGLSSARNAGMSIAKGNYVIFPDPDDWVEPDYVESLLQIQSQYQPDLACVGHFIAYDHGEVLSNQGQKGIQMDAQSAQKALLIPPCMNGFAWNKLYHLDLIRKHQLTFLDDVGTTEDLDFAFRYLQYCNKVYFAPDVGVYHYYQRTGAATHSVFSRRKIDSIHTYEKIIEAKVGQTDLVQAAREEICNIAINLLWAYQNEGCDDLEAKEKLQDYLRENIGVYLQSKRYGFGRKIQAILAQVSPKLYCKFKNKVTKN